MNTVLTECEYNNGKNKFNTVFNNYEEYKKYMGYSNNFLTYIPNATIYDYDICNDKIDDKKDNKDNKNKSNNQTVNYINNNNNQPKSNNKTINYNNNKKSSNRDKKKKKMN